MIIENNEYSLAEQELLLKLQEVEDAIKNESSWLTLEELKKTIGAQQ